ncbi:MAG: ferredoxin [Thermodesulfobacteriota bacterium]
MTTHYVYVNIDTYRCNGCGTCAALCPGVFRMSEDGEKAELIDGCVPLSEELERSASMCPEKCIELEAC